LIKSGELKCSEEILSIAAMLSVQSVFITPKENHRRADGEKLKFSVHDGDHLTLLNVFNSFLLNAKDAKWYYHMPPISVLNWSDSSKLIGRMIDF
jgi:HrpA-like RNA helicase